MFDGFSALNNIRISNIAVKMGISEEQKVEDEICLAVMEAYYNVLYHSQMVAVMKSRIEEARENVTLVRRKLELGQKGRADVVQMEADLADRDEKCVLQGDPVNEWIQKMKEADGILLGAPVHYAGMAAGFKAFLDRAFYVCGNSGNLLRHKVGAAVTAVRRSGGIASIDGLYHYLTYSEMLLPTSNYWSVIHGLKPGQVEEDAEGMQIMEVLGRNMAWLMKLKEYGKDAVPAPAPVKKAFTNFIR